MSTHVQVKPLKRAADATGDWVKPERIAQMFDVSVSAVYRGFAGMDQIRSAYMSEGGEKNARRWYLPDAIALKRRMLASATAQREQMSEPLRFGRRS